MTAIDRRSALLAGLGVAGAGLLGARTREAGARPAPSPAPAGRRPDHVQHVRLNAEAGTVDLGGRQVRTWSYDGRLPGREVRVPVGTTLVADLANHLPEGTSVHWHGIRTPIAMDGAPPITPEVAAGSSFTYRFTATDPGTYWLHSHVGTQRDRGLYAPVVVEDPDEPLHYEDEWVLVLDDWLDGVTGTPDQALAELQGPAGTPIHAQPPRTGTPAPATPAPSAPGTAGPGGFRLAGATSALLGGDAGNIAYPYYLVNGRLPTAPDTYRGRPGRRVRLRVINAAADTAFRVALGDHRLTVTHTDGYPVEHEEVDTVLLAPAERYDLLVTLGDGVFPLVALAEGRNASAMALVRTGRGTAPPPTVRPKELQGRLVPATSLRAAEEARLEPRRPEVTHRIELTGGSKAHDWGFDGRRFDMAHPLAHPWKADFGQRVLLQLVNTTKMGHPIHLHGHTFQTGRRGPRKDTVLVLPGTTVTCAFDADNPGPWLLHCHLLYHELSGMMGVVSYPGRRTPGGQ